MSMAGMTLGHDESRRPTTTTGDRRRRQMTDGGRRRSDDDGRRRKAGGGAPTTRLAGECPSPFSATCADGAGRPQRRRRRRRQRHSRPRRRQPPGAGPMGQPVPVTTTTSGSVHRAIADVPGHVNRRALDVRDVVGAATAGDRGSTLNPPYPRYGCRRAGRRRLT